MIGYKSETGSTLLAVAAFGAACFFPMKSILCGIPIWAACSRFLARGARCRVCPQYLDAQKKEKPFHKGMTLNERPVCIVTGTNSGIGYHTAVGLAAEGFEVIITCRSEQLTVQTAKRIQAAAEKLRQSSKKKYANAPEGVVVVGRLPIECDNFASIHAFVRWFTGAYRGRNFQVLVNNAGCMRQDLSFSAFDPQLELHMAANFLGPLLLTELLLPMLEGNDGRVVYVSSEAHRFPQSTLEGGTFGLWKKKDPKKSLVAGKLINALKQVNQGEKASGPLSVNSTRNAFIRYGTSKLLNTYHAHHIARRYAKHTKGRVHACSLHPGCVVTGFQRDLVRSPFLARLYEMMGLLFLKSSEEGAQTSLHCAMCPRSCLELVSPAKGAESVAVSPYFVECSEKTRAMLLGYGWDLDEGEEIVRWGKSIVGLPQ